jgi:uncharacterized protein
MIDIYLKHYSETEIQDMLAFYRTKTGQSMIIKMPAVMGESIILSQKMMKDFIPKIKAMAQDLQKERREKKQEG